MAVGACDEAAADERPERKCALQFVDRVDELLRPKLDLYTKVDRRPHESHKRGTLRAVATHFSMSAELDDRGAPPNLALGHGRTEFNAGSERAHRDT